MAKRLRQTKRREGIRHLFLGAAIALVLWLAPTQARADHSLGYSCIVCHTLRSTNVVPGSRNVLATAVSDDLYHADWYCGSEGWTTPPNPGDQPLDCGYCHDQDIGLEISESKGGAVGSAHPVGVKNDTVTYGADIRIICNDCHDGTVPGRVTPDGKCSKSDVDGYPNHINTVTTGAPPGENDLVGNPPRLSKPYLPGDVDWTGQLDATTLLCFICHDGNPATQPNYSTLLDPASNNIAGEYNAVNGGHNIPGIGIGVGGVDDKKLPCYHCHDPHASTNPGYATGFNKALLVDYVARGEVHPMAAKEPGVTPYNEFDMGSSVDYDGTNDKALCTGCHDGGTHIEGQTVFAWDDTAYIQFDFHQDVHTNPVPTNCLNANGGCHPSVHNTNIFNCTGCHAEVLSEFDTANGIVSRHDIPIGDGTTAATNGCLNCHNVAYDGSATKYRVSYGGTDYERPTMADRQSLSDYDDFCLDCHDGSGSSFTVGGNTYHPPEVDEYFKTEGHGASSSFKSGNVASNIPCLECHLYHGSTAYKLLPGNVATTDGLGNVIKGETGATTVGATFSIGGVTDSTKIDYLDYTVSANNSRLVDDMTRAWKYANYTNTSPWNSYYSDTSEPAGTEVSFGTSGDMLANTKSANEVDCGKDATSATKIGFCNACHFYNDTTDGTKKNSTDGTMGWIYTHESYYTDPATTNCNGDDYPSKRKHFKDCAECHDPHGSGATGGATPNWYMVRGKIVHGDDSTDTTDQVVFTDTGNDGSVEIGCDGLDEDEDVCTGAGDAGDRDDICAVCHTDPTLKYHLADGSRPKHNEGRNCAAKCHSHGWKTVRGTSSVNERSLGFANSNDCTSCHGYPPQPTAATTPPEENYVGGGGAHEVHVAFLESKTGANRVDYPTLELCGPCHGRDAGDVTHDMVESEGVWAIASRGSVDIGDRNEEKAWGANGTYGGVAIPTPAPPPLGTIHPPGAIMNEDNSRCAGLLCHGEPDSTFKLSWLTAADAATADTANVIDGDIRNHTCEGCHDETPAILDIYDVGGTSVYTATAIDAAANYFGTISGYGRGGHGDPTIQDEDPFVDSDPSHTTRETGVNAQDGLDCTACHDATADHFPATGNLHRLVNTVIEDGDAGNGLCNGCHDRAHYPGLVGQIVHHPSYVYKRRNETEKPLVPHPNQEVRQDVTGSTGWQETPPGSLHYAQTAYGAGNSPFYGNPDLFIDWWGGDPGGTLISPPPKPVFFGESPTPTSSGSRATLPLEPNIYRTGTTYRVICVTCHNPHGTDLFVYLPGGSVDLSKIPDNNMLRLRDGDNTLCDACH